MGFPQTKLFTTTLIISMLVIGILFINGSSGDVNANTDDMYRNIELFTEVLRQVEENYVEPQETKKLIEGAIKGMMQSLDPHSTYMTKEEHDDLRVETQGSFTGVGMQITVRDNVLTVIAPIEDTPAYNAGLKPGDIIVKIEGEITRGITLQEAVKKLRGEPNTEVTLTILKERDKRLEDVTITRDIIKIQDIKRALILEDGIGYIKLAEFRETTAKDLSKALKDLQQEEMQALILDLRNNPGGLLISAVEVADTVTPEKLADALLLLSCPESSKRSTSCLRKDVF